MKHSNPLFAFLILISLIATSCATVHKTPLIEASIQGNSLAAEKLIREGANINEPDSNGVTPLVYAIRAGNTEIAKHLIKSGADIKTKNKNGVDALICAVDYGQIEIVNTLLDRGANIESKDQTGSTPLAYAVACGHYDIIELLLNRGADINTKDWTGATPIANAIRGSASNKIIQLLIKRGANLNIKGTEGYTPLDWALFYKRMDIAAEIKKALADARKDTPSAKIVFIRESNVLIPGEFQDVLIYIDEAMVAKLSRDSMDYVGVNPGKTTIVVKGGKLEGNHLKSFDAVAGQTYYFLVTKRIGSSVGGFAGVIGQVVESQIAGEKAGPFEITPLEEPVAKEKIKALKK